VLYLDSSAIVKLVVLEPETPQLVEAVRADPDAVASILAWSEVVRAVRRTKGPLPRARRVLRGLALIPMDEGIIREAGELPPVELRTLDAIHLATALSVREDLSSFVTYDEQLGKAATRAGLAVTAPGLRNHS
jgi:predicted nucleic acid-binding protein